MLVLYISTATSVLTPFYFDLFIIVFLFLFVCFFDCLFVVSHPFPGICVSEGDFSPVYIYFGTESVIRFFFR